MADLPPIKVRVEEPTIPEFVVQIMVKGSGSVASSTYTSDNKIGFSVY